MMRVTESSIGNEQGGVRKGRRCVDQIFVLKVIVEKYLEKDRKFVAAFMDLEKAHDNVDRRGLWDVHRVYGVGGGHLLEGVKSFYRDVSASV